MLNNSGVMSFNTERLSFLDAINFVGGMSLKQFGLNYAGMSVSKGIFPHRKFNSIEQMKMCKTFPSYDDFKSDLNPTRPEDCVKYYNEYVQYKTNLDPNCKDMFCQTNDITTARFHTSVELYLECKLEFDSNIKSQNWSNFLVFDF